MSKTYLISDEHYKHDKILHLMGCRPYKHLKDMERSFNALHNAIVQPEDTVYHLGDVFFGDNWKELASILSKLNGKHHLIIGNHDWMYIWNYIEAGFVSVHTSLVVDGYTLVHDPAVAGVLTDRNFIHGHTHALGLNLSPNTYSVSVEMHNYKPVDFDVIKEYFERNK